MPSRSIVTRENLSSDFAIQPGNASGPLVLNLNPAQFARDPLTGVISAPEGGTDTFISRADAEAASVPQGVITVQVRHLGRFFSYVRTTANTDLAALTTNGGAWFWVPMSRDGTYDPAAWGDGWEALRKCAMWQVAANGRISIRTTGLVFQKPAAGSVTLRRIAALNVPVQIDLGNCLMQREETDTQPFFAFSGGYSANTTVTAVSYENVTYTDEDGEEDEGGTESTSTKRTVLTLASATGFEDATGQVAFLSSADPNPHHPVRLMGEHVVIDRIEGTSVRVHGRLYGDYTPGASLRLWLLRNRSIRIRGGIWVDQGNRDVANRNTAPMIHIEAAKGPVVEDMDVRFAESHVVQFANCYDYVADGFTTDYMANKTNSWHNDDNPVGENPVAYIVRVANSQAGVVRDFRGRHLRHVVDHLCLPASSFSSFSYLRDNPADHPIGIGATIACRVEGCFSQGASSAPIGTHDGTIGCIFSNNTVIQPRTTAWALRGVNHVMQGNRDEGAVNGIRAFIGSNWIGPPRQAQSRGLVVRNHTSVNLRGNGVILNDGADSVRIDGWTIIFTTDADPEVSPQRIVWMKNGGDVAISNLTIEARRQISIGEFARIEGTNDSTLRIEGGSWLDYHGAGQITTLINNIGTGDCTHMIRNASAHRVPDQSQFVQSLYTGRAPKAGSHIRQSRIVGIWSQEQVAPSRAAMLANGYVSPEVTTLSFMEDGYKVDLGRNVAGHVTLTDGSVWGYLDVLPEDITVTVPGDYPTVNDAVRAHLGCRPINGARVEVQIEAGHTINNLFALSEGEHADYVRITSVDAVVPAVVQHLPGQEIFGTDGSFAWAVDARAPTLACLIDAGNTGPSDAKGITILGPGASMRIEGGAGLRNLGLRSNLSGAGAWQFGYGLLVWNGGEVWANEAEISGSAGRNLWISRNASMTGAYGNFSGAQGQAGGGPADSANHGNVYCTRFSRANLEYANLSNAANRGITSIRSDANVEGADCRNNPAGDMAVDRGGILRAYGTRTTGSPEASFPFTPQRADIRGATEFNNIFGAGFILSEQNANWPHRIFYTDPVTSATWLITLDATGEIQMRTRDATALTLTFTSSTELRDTVTFPTSLSAQIPLPAMANTEYSVSISLRNPSRAALRGNITANTFSRGLTSVVIAAQSNGLFLAGDTCTAEVLIVGRWK